MMTSIKMVLYIHTLKCSSVPNVFLKYITIKQKIKKTKPPAKDKLLKYKALGETETVTLPGSSNRDAQKSTSCRDSNRTKNAPMQGWDRNQPH